MIIIKGQEIERLSSFIQQLGEYEKYIIRISQYFPKPNECSGGNMKVELDLSNDATKADLEGATGVDTSKLAVKSDLASLEAQLDKLDVDKDSFRQCRVLAGQLPNLNVIQTNKT